MRKILCNNCGHSFMQHADFSAAGDHAGLCYAMNGHCSCTHFYVSDAEGSDIRDVDEGNSSQGQEGAGSTNQAAEQSEVSDNDHLVYDASVDSLVTDPTPINQVNAEQTMDRATNIINNNYFPKGDKRSQKAHEGFKAFSSQNEENDPVNHPSHYTAYPGIEVIQLTRWLGFNKGNAVKYIARAGLKSEDKKIEDLEKAIWYLQDEIKALKGEYGTFEG